VTELDDIVAQRLTARRRCPCRLSERELFAAYGVDPDADVYRSAGSPSRPVRYVPESPSR